MLCGWVCCFALLCGRGRTGRVSGLRATSRTTVLVRRCFFVKTVFGAPARGQPRMGPASSLPPRPPQWRCCARRPLAAASLAQPFDGKHVSIDAYHDLLTGGWRWVRARAHSRLPQSGRTSQHVEATTAAHPTSQPARWPADRNHRHPPGARSTRAMLRTPKPKGQGCRGTASPGHWHRPPVGKPRSDAGGTDNRGLCQTSPNR